ncbi:M15 family metallopeptidase [Pectobacterium parmentieri]|uniref:M15 family metallopeptidase n=1 Tax=Pectobacterium parmentieri TaxID=1905730 RepID=UPI00215AC2B9|nr:M15 family metallopeptidase [Pectobacterium parmentieri]
MSFKFSQRSENNLIGVNPNLINVVRRALEITNVDFTVIEGLRTLERQKSLYAQGRTMPGNVVTWTMKSKHIDGLAVDLLPVVGGWDGDFLSISRAMLNSASDLGVNIRWGADWNQNGRPYEKGEFDSPHFEIA